MQEPRKPLFNRPMTPSSPAPQQGGPLFTQPVPQSGPAPQPAQQDPLRRERRRRRLHLFALWRNILAVIGAAFLVVELLRLVIIPYVLVPLNGLIGG
ncbi:MAG: hypothetical protein IKP40_06730 [Clostridia bacterium]|nr:hypothetical protein [Clostridia bacterium]